MRKLMGETAEKSVELMERFCDKVVLVLGGLIFSALSYYSLRYTEIFRKGTEVMETHVDSVSGNIIAFLAFVLLFFAFRMAWEHIPEKKQHIVARVIKIAMLVYVGIISALWVTFCHVIPSADPKSLCMVSELFYHGDYGSMVPVGYMSYNPHQYGMVLILEGLYGLFGDKNYIAFQYMNAALIILAVYAGQKLIELIFENDIINIFYSLLAVAFVPMTIYAAYVYGEIPSIALCMVLMWNAVKYCKTGSKWTIPFMLVSAAIAGVVRMNSLIVMIAVAVVLLICGIRKKQLRFLFIVGGIFLSVSVLNSSVKKLYEYRSGITILEGTPHISYIMMGLEDTEFGPGWFNQTTYLEYEKYDFDCEATKEADTEWVKTRLAEMWSNKPSAIDFFRRKILTQWNSPDYNAFYSVRRIDCEPGELPKSVQSLLDGNLRKFLDAFMNRYQFMVYFSVVCGAIFLMKRKNPIEHNILLIAVIGGMLFSIIWEAKSRYILPYMFFSLPMAAMGIYAIQEWGLHLGKIILKK